MDALTCTTGAQLSRALAAAQHGVVALRVPPSRGAEEAILGKLAAEQAAGRSVLLLCADEVIAQTYRNELAAAGVPSSIAKRILTVRDAALSIMTNADVQQACGRGARIIDGNELDVLLEDIKVTGIKPKRLREMLKFFYNSIANCHDEDPAWLVSGEERQVYQVLQENLVQRRSILSHELAAMAWRGATGCEAGVEDFGADVVVADGFDLMSASNQRLARGLARGLFIATGSQPGASSPAEEYPNPSGFEVLCADEQATHLVLQPACSTIPASVHIATTPADEFAAVAHEAAKLMEGGADAAGILIGAPNRIWCKRIAQNLNALGIPCCIDSGRGKLKGDPRYPESAGQIAARAFFRLQLDPDDVTALRTWLGIGDWLLCSEPFLEMLAYAKTGGMSVLEAIRALHADTAKAADMVLFRKVDARLDALDELNAAYAEGSKRGIIEAFERHGIECNAAARELLDKSSETLSEQELAGIALAGVGDVPDLPVPAGKASGPSLVDAIPSAVDSGSAKRDSSGARSCVTIAPYGRCVGRKAHHLLLCGMVNGFLPSLAAIDDRYTIDERARARARETAFFDYLKAIPTQSLGLSLFEQDLLENAGKLNMSTTRVFMKDGVRRARIAPSLFVEQLTQGDSAKA